MIDYCRPVCEQTMFRGRNLPVWLCMEREETQAIIDQYGREKIDKVYRFFFRLLSQMQWGSWMVVEKMCPHSEDRRLLYWCLELIYQSDMLSQFRFSHEDGETRIYCVPPSDEVKKSCNMLLGRGRYLLVDWYSRLKADPTSNKDIDPMWLFPDLSSVSVSGDQSQDQYLSDTADD